MNGRKKSAAAPKNQEQFRSSNQHERGLNHIISIQTNSLRQNRSHYKTDLRSKT